MRKTNKILAVVLSVMMLLSVLPIIPFSVSALTEGMFTYYVSDGKATITGLTDKSYSGDLTIPSTIGGYPVTGLYDFYGCTGVKSIIIPNSVSSIVGVFEGCTSIESVTIAEGVTVIIESFCNCINLKNIVLPDSVTEISWNSFYNTGYYNDENNWENGVLYIGNHLIKAKEDIYGEYIINTGTKTIADNAFYGCTNLAKITFPDSIVSVGELAFHNCSGITSIDFGNSLKEIGMDAFSRCTGLTSITIPDSVTSISWYAFSGCSNIKSVFIGKSVEYIGYWAFGHTDLESITVDENNAVLHSDGNCVIDTDSKTLILGCKNSSIPDDGSVKIISHYAFSWCTGLTSVTIPNSVTSIADSAFSGCEGLTSITIPDSVTYIGEGAFSGCSSLEEITLPFVGDKRHISSDTYQYPFGYIFGTNSYTGGTATTQFYYGNSTSIATSSTYYIPSSLKKVTITDCEYLQYGAFYNCNALKSVTIPDSVTSIGSCAFAYCSGLKSITIPDSVTSIGSSAFFHCHGLTSITIPDGLNRIDSGMFEYCWSLTNITIPNSVTLIGQWAFSGCSGLISIKIPDSVTSIGSCAFYDCTGLASINIPDSVTSIYYWTFIRCSSLMSVAIGNSVTSIGDNAFEGCTSLTNIAIPDSVTSIGDCAFSGCSGLISIKIPDSVTSIGDCAFGGCDKLTSITIPDSVISIGRNPIGCAGLKNIIVEESNAFYHSSNNCLIETESKTLIAGCKNSIIPSDGSVTSIGDTAFGGCDKLTSITIPDSVTEIGDSAFDGCDGLTSITIPDSVTYIGDMAFSNCTGLTSITISDNVTQIGDCTFYFCTELKSITIPNSVTSIGGGAFYGCSELTDVYYTGTEQQKNSIIFNYENDCFLNATWHYNYVPPCAEHKTIELRNKKTVTCTADGYTGDTVCADCGVILEMGEVIPALGHSGIWKTITKATLTEKGLKQEICSRCGEILDNEEIPALGVTYSIDTAKENTKENISVAQSAGSNLPETAEVKAEKSEITEDSITYEIHIENEGQEIQPQAPVLVKLPVPAGFNAEKLNIYRRGSDGTKTRMDYIIDGDYAYFETDHFSVYEIIEKLCGDISGDGSLNNGDLVTLFQYLSGWGNEVNRKAVDVNGDGKENNQDLVLLFQFLSGWDVEIF